MEGSTVDAQNDGVSARRNFDPDATQIGDADFGRQAVDSGLVERQMASLKDDHTALGALDLGGEAETRSVDA